jgi:hypothetical protein
VLGTQDLQAAPGEPILGPLISELKPRLLLGTAWLLAGVAALILWYRLPVHPFHKAILMGLVPYLIIFAASLHVIETGNWDTEVRETANYVFPTVWVLVLAYWAHAAWRKDSVPVQAPEPTPMLEKTAG